jgi:hypothetical protein
MESANTLLEPVWLLQNRDQHVISNKVRNLEQTSKIPEAKPKVPLGTEGMRNLTLDTFQFSWQAFMDRIF